MFRLLRLQRLAIWKGRHVRYRRLVFGLPSGLLAITLVFYWLQPAVLAATKIDDAGDPGAMPNYGRQVVRTSSGTIYTLINDGGSCEIWKSSDGSSWTEQDTADNPACSTDLDASVAVDSTDVLHLLYNDDAAADLTKYIPYTTSTDQFGTEATAIDAVGTTQLDLDIAVDSNNIPHAIKASNITSDSDIEYSNRIGGSWKAAVSVESHASTGGLAQISLAISEDNIPEIAYTNNFDTDLTAALGNANDASSFSLQDVDTTVPNTINRRGGTIVVDSSGNTYIGYLDSGATPLVSLVKHNDADAWTTWQAPVTTSNEGNEPAAVAKGTDIYVFYEDELDDIKYNLYNGSFQGETNLQTGTYQDVHPKWAYYNDNHQSSHLDYLFSDGTDIYWDEISFQFPPAAPVLSAPADGATIIPLTGNSFQGAATDPGGDAIKYHIKIFNTTSQSGGNCDGSTFEEQDQNVAQGGWSQAGSYSSGATATYSNQTSLVRGSSYCWQMRGKDPLGSNTFGAWSTPRTFTVNSIPATPTLINPSSSQTDISVLPQFTLRATDADSDYIKYHLKVYSNSGGTGEANCNADSATNLVRSIDQTASQTGWLLQDMDSGNAYNGGVAIGNSTVAIHNYQPAALSANTVYWWKGRSIDPGGTNIFSGWATCLSFTTSTSEVQIQGGTEIRGGTTIQ